MTQTQISDPALFWHDSFGDELLGFLTKRLRCAETAADLTQETFLRLHESALVKPPDNARALAYRIAINLANDYQRKLNVRNRFGAELEPGTNADNYPSASSGPEQIVIAQERLNALQAALTELDMVCRTAFLLHSINGLTHREIADQLGISTPKVYRLLVKAMNHLALRVGDGR